MKSIIFAITFICPPFIKKVLLQLFCGAEFGRGAYIGWFSAVMGQRKIVMGDYSRVCSLTLIKCDGEFNLGAYSEVSSFSLIYGASSFIMGSHSYIGPQCLINVSEDVRVGSITSIGPRCLVFTHGSFLPYTEGYWARFAGVEIGDYVIIAAGAFIHPGVKIGDRVFVNSRSVIKNNVSSGDVVEGFPAKRVAAMDNIQRHMTPERVDAAARRMLEHFIRLIIAGRMNLETRMTSADWFSFRWKKRRYNLVIITSSGEDQEFETLDSDQRYIFISNRRLWKFPAQLKHAWTIGLNPMTAELSPDIICQELRLFLKRYYGLKFELKDRKQEE